MYSALAENMKQENAPNVNVKGGNMKKNMSAILEI